MSYNFSSQRYYVVISKTYESGEPLYRYEIWSRETGRIVYSGYELHTDPELCQRDAQEALDLIEAGGYEKPMNFSVGNLFYTQNYGC